MEYEQLTPTLVAEAPETHVVVEAVVSPLIVRSLGRVSTLQEQGATGVDDATDHNAGRAAFDSAAV